MVFFVSSSCCVLIWRPSCFMLFFVLNWLFLVFLAVFHRIQSCLVLSCRSLYFLGFHLVNFRIVLILIPWIFIIFCRSVLMNYDGSFDHLWPDFGGFGLHCMNFDSFSYRFSNFLYLLILIWCLYLASSSRARLQRKCRLLRSSQNDWMNPK